jgi:hypothetical protein
MCKFRESLSLVDTGTYIFSPLGYFKIRIFVFYNLSMDFQKFIEVVEREGTSHLDPPGSAIGK